MTGGAGTAQAIGLLRWGQGSVSAFFDRAGRRAAGPVSDSPDQEHTPRVTLLGGSALAAFALPTRKSPLDIEAFNGLHKRAGGLTAPATAQGRPYRDATNKTGSGGLAFRCLIGVLIGFEDNAFVEFGEGKFDPDLGEGENGVGDQDFVCPRLA